MTKATAAADRQYIVTTPDLDQLGRSGNGRITVEVQGYWANDSITVCINREQHYSSAHSHLPFSEHPHTWVATESHSSGGRDNKEVPSDLDAAQNFGLAILAATTAARVMLSHAPGLEAIYQAEQRHREELDTAKQAAKQAAIDADRPVGAAAASTVFLNAKKAATQSGTHTIVAFHRGSDQTVTFTVDYDKCTHMTLIAKDGARLALSKAVDALAALSARGIVV